MYIPDHSLSSSSVARSPAVVRRTIAEDILLKPYGHETSQLRELLAGLQGKGVDDADFYLQYSCSESWGIEEGIVKSGHFSTGQGIGVRAVMGEKTAFAYSDDLSLDAIRKTTKAISGLHESVAYNANAKTPSQRKNLSLFSGKATFGGREAKRDREHAMESRLYSDKNCLLSLDSETKVGLLKRLEQKARALDSRVIQVMASLNGVWETVLIMRADGFVAADVRPLVRLSVQVVMEQQGRRETGSASGGGRFDYSYFNEDILDKYAKQAIESAKTNLDAIPAPAGEMSVVLGPGWPGILLHEAIGHGLEGDFNRKGSSAFANSMGKMVAAKEITVVDDGTIADRRGSLNVDDEGNQTNCTPLIEKGRLVGFLQDRMNARLLNTHPTGNGRRESYAHIPMPRMTNTYMQNGPHTPEEVISSVKKGVYARNFGGGQVDITNGKFVFSASEAWLIENGRLTVPIKGATLIGNGPNALTKVRMVANDMSLDSGVGTCGKEGQSVPVGVGQPTLRIDGLTVGGTG